MRRRTDEVLRAARDFRDLTGASVVDLGAADGYTLQAAIKHGAARAIGVEYSAELAATAKGTYDSVEIVRGDIQVPPLRSGRFDLAIAAAVVEHLTTPQQFFAEALRLLRPGGLLIVTSPDPLWERLATHAGHLSAGQHENVPSLRQLRLMVEKAGLTILRTRKFMLSPVGLPFERAIECVLRAIGLRVLLANQLLVAQKPGEARTPSSATQR